MRGLCGGLNGVEMIERVEPLAHDLSLSPLDCDLVLGEGSEENEQADGVDSGPVGPDLGDAGSHQVGEVVLIDVQHAYGGGARSEESSAAQDSFRVVESIYNSLVLLPLVCLHLIIIFIIITQTQLITFPSIIIKLFINYNTKV